MFANSSSNYFRYVFKRGYKWQPNHVFYSIKGPKIEFWWCRLLKEVRKMQSQQILFPSNHTKILIWEMRSFALLYCISFEMRFSVHMETPKPELGHRILKESSSPNVMIY